MSLDYGAYVLSERFALLRERVLEHYNFRCAVCGETRGLMMHHLSYASLGTENEVFDCIILCRQCHSIRHGVKA